MPVAWNLLVHGNGGDAVRKNDDIVEILVNSSGDVVGILLEVEGIDVEIARRVKGYTNMTRCTAVVSQQRGCTLGSGSPDSLPSFDGADEAVTGAHKPKMGAKGIGITLSSIQ